LNLKHERRLAVHWLSSMSPLDKSILASVSLLTKILDFAKEPYKGTTDTAHGWKKEQNRAASNEQPAC
jgi:hypothetical protein